MDFVTRFTELIGRLLRMAPHLDVLSGVSNLVEIMLDFPGKDEFSAFQIFYNMEYNVDTERMREIVEGKDVSEYLVVKEIVNDELTSEYVEAFLTVT